MNAVAVLVRRVDRGLALLELVLISVAMAVMFCAVAIGVVDRTFALPWPDLSEVALACMSVIAFIGGAYCVHGRSYIAVDAVNTLGPPRLRLVLSAVVWLTILVFSLAVLVYGGRFLAYVVQMGERTPELGFPLAIPVSCLVVGAALSLFHLLCQAIAGQAREGSA